MFGGFTIEKIIMIGVIAAILIGPERLPHAAEWLGRTARKTREYVQGARSRVQEEMGEELGDVDWKKLDPRQYDPRRIIREALLDDDTPHDRGPRGVGLGRDPAHDPARREDVQRGGAAAVRRRGHVAARR